MLKSEGTLITPRAYVCEASSLRISDAPTEEGATEHPFHLTRYEATVLAEHYLRELVQIDASWELMQLSGGSQIRMRGYIEERLDALVNSGHITLEKLRSLVSR